MGIYKRGNTWWIDYYLDGRRIRQNTHTTIRRRAEEILAKVRTETIEGRLNLQRVQPSPKLKDFVERYLEHSKQNKKPSSHKRDCLSVKMLNEFFGHKRLRDIHPLLIEHYKKRRLEAHKSTATINREVACLKHIFSMAIVWGVAFDNPVKRVRMFHEDNEITNPLSDEDEALLLENAAPHLMDIIICALDTGMRRGEIFEMRWADVNLASRSIRVVKTKTNKKRDIPISARLQEVLGRLKRHSKNEYVFVSPKTGEKLTKVDTAFHRAIERAGLEAKGYRFHDLRHTFATRLIEEGESPVVVKELLGHSSLRMLERYAHPGEPSKRDAIQALDRRRRRKTVIDFEQGKS